MHVCASGATNTQCFWVKVLGLNKILFTHRNHKLNKQVQETQKQYAYLSVTYIQNDK